MLSVSVDGDRIRFGERFSLSFQRTLRIPDDGKIYPLPPGLGNFPVRWVEDYATRAPAAWREWGGVFIPMYQREALWLAFDGAYWKPNAVKIGVGRINAVSGEAWDAALHAAPQDYLVCPPQPWLDGINAGEDTIRQFVAMPLGGGYTVEAQLSGKEEYGGIQVLVYEPKAGRFPDAPSPEPVRDYQPPFGPEADFISEAAPARAMGLGAGGRMEQKIYPDAYGVGTWALDNYGELFVHIVNSEQYQSITGEPAPPSPVSARTYTTCGLPWFELYDEQLDDVAPADKLVGVKSLAEQDREKGLGPSPEDEEFDVEPGQVKQIKP